MAQILTTTISIYTTFLSYGKLSLDLQTTLFMGIVDNFEVTKKIFTELIADNLPEISREVVGINLEMGHFDTATLSICVLH